jgi:hypothetical protein
MTVIPDSGAPARKRRFEVMGKLPSSLCGITVMAAMLTMKKIDVEALRRAASTAE